MDKKVWNMYPSLRTNRCQSGQAYAETIVGFAVIGLFLMGAQHLWRTAEVSQQITYATRFAAWERTVWEPSDNTVEKFAVHQADTSLAHNVVMFQFSEPSAWRAFRANLQTDGTPAQNVDATSPTQRRLELKPAMQALVSPGQDPNSLVTITTDSGWTNDVEHAFRGMDPTHGALTSLELDRDTYRTVHTHFASLALPSLQRGIFSFLMPKFETDTKLSLITNTWAASPPVNFVRTERQLLPLSTGDKNSGTKPNNLAYFGITNDVANNLVGMVPWWNFVGGPNGFAGQFLVREIGLDAGASNNLIQTGGSQWTGSWTLDDNNRMDNLLLKAQYQQSEYFNPNAVSGWHHRHTFVIDGADEPRNATIGKRKYRAISLQNPVEQYYTP